MSSQKTLGIHPIFGASVECIPGLDICQPLDIQAGTYSENFNRRKYSEALKAGKHRLIEEFQIIKCIKKTPPTEMYSGYDKKRNEGVSLVLYDSESCDGDFTRELSNIRKVGSSKHILEFYGTVYTESIQKTYLSFENFECFLSQLLCKAHFEVFETCVVKCVMIQLLNGLKFLHEKKLVHGDISPKNVIITESGLLKISNFKRAHPEGKCQKEVSTLEFCYQPVEVLFQFNESHTTSDIWSASCIFAEMLLKQKLFKSLLIEGVLKEIFEILGFPNKDIWPEFAEVPHYKGIRVCNFQKYNNLGEYFQEESVLRCLRKGFIYSPKHRISAETMLLDPYFIEDPIACSTKNFGLKIHNKKFKDVRYSLPPRG